MKRLSTVAIFVVLVCSTTARADDTALARQHYQKGSTLYDLGHFHDAAKEYEEAYKLHSDPVLLFNIGQAYRFAGENADALLAYRAYLRRMPDASNRRDVEAHIARLQKLVDEQRAAAAAAHPAAPPQPPAPQPSTTAQPAPAAGTPAVTTTAPAAEKPIYKRWWLWTAVGGVLVVGAVAFAVAYTTPKDAPAPPGALTVTF